MILRTSRDAEDSAGHARVQGSGDEVCVRVDLRGARAPQNQSWLRSENRLIVDKDHIARITAEGEYAVRADHGK